MCPQVQSIFAYYRGIREGVEVKTGAVLLLQSTSIERPPTCLKMVAKLEVQGS